MRCLLRSARLRESSLDHSLQPPMVLVRDGERVEVQSAQLLEVYIELAHPFAMEKFPASAECTDVQP